MKTTQLNNLTYIKHKCKSTNVENNAKAIVYYSRTAAYVASKLLCIFAKLI